MVSGEGSLFSLDRSSEKNRVFTNKRLILAGIIVGLVVIGTLGSSIYYYLQYQNAKNVLGSKAPSTATQSSELIKKVGMLIELPKGETPTIATVSDITKLKGQAFFQKAKNGDKVLIYQKAKKAILYDPVANKIIEVQAINITDGNNSASASASVSPTPAQIKVVLLNGTKTVGLATTTEKSLTTELKYITVISKGDAKTDAISTTVVDLTGKNSAAAVQIANILKGQVGKLPSGEVKPTNTDILVILGKQQ